MSKHQFIRDGDNCQEWCDGNYKMSDACSWVKWVWANLVNQFTRWESLRIINVAEASSALNENAPSPIWMEVNSGKSSQSLTSQSFTLKHNTRTTTECTTAQLNGSQFRQVYSITHISLNHSQTQHKNKRRMYLYQARVIWEKACLVITLYEWEYSSTPTKHNGNCNSIHMYYR